MNATKFLKDIDFSPDNAEIDSIKESSSSVLEKLRAEIKKKKIDAEVFVGGSFAKDTMIKSKDYDIDIFIRFNKKYDNFSKILEKIIKHSFNQRKFKVKKVHGSRDYFRINENKKITLEIIPVTKIRKPSEEQNVTDLSYFHVNYVKKKLRKHKDLKRQIQIAKRFCKSNGFYGAESYIQGFSGYSLECLIIYYKTFEKMLKSILKSKEKIIIDQEKHYKNKNEILIELNESKLFSPIILVDPTWKERNALAALNEETFEKFKKSARSFLKKPSMSFFKEKVVSESVLRKKAKMQKLEFLKIVLKTNRQEGDIAGTKLKKFSTFISRELSEHFEIKLKEFIYLGEKESILYLILKPKKELIKQGPKLGMKKHVASFKKKNKNTFKKSGRIYSKSKVSSSALKFLKSWTKTKKNKSKEMGIISISLS